MDVNDRRHKDAEWLLNKVNPRDDNTIDDFSIVQALLMDLRDELKALNRTQRANTRALLKLLHEMGTASRNNS